MLCSYISYGQTGRISGVITDSDGLPIPGVTIYIKGTTKGTQTDFDGNYSISCVPGDILVFSYVGMTTKEVKITSAMLHKFDDNNFEYEYVNLKTNKYYKTAVESLKKQSDTIVSIDNKPKKVNRNLTSGKYQKIKEVKVGKDKVRLNFYSPEIYYEVGLNSRTGLQFVRDDNLPELQSQFSQGLSFNGNIEFVGPETNTIFSYGPEIAQLEFDGTNYEYDDNGRLVGSGNGNGTPAKAYDNCILRTVITNSNHLFFNVSTEHESINLDLQNANAKDIFNKELNTDNKISLKYERPSYRENEHGWYTYLSYQDQVDNQPNINGFLNNLLLNSWATPPSFSNKQKVSLVDNVLRSFSNAFNNPEWLFENNRNAIETKVFMASAFHTYRFSKNLKLISGLNYNHDNNLQKFGVIRGTSGFEQGFFSNKKIVKNSLNAEIDLQFEKDINNYDELKLSSKIDHNHADMQFSLNINEDLNPMSFSNPQSTFERIENRNRNIFRLNHKAELNMKNGYGFKLVNNSYYSSIQNNKWFLPGLGGHINFEQIFDLYSPFSEILLSAFYSQNINDMPLYYDNLSHNSLVLDAESVLGYTSNNDLFISPDIDLEEVETFEINLDFGINLLGYYDRFSFGFYNTQTKGSVFPVMEQQNFDLKNIANIRTTGFEAEYYTSIWLGNGINLIPKISFSTYNSKVTDLHDNRSRVAIAGFSDVSKNLIENKPTGSIVGSAYLRDDLGNVIISADGFPMIAPNPKIIGNPIPDYNIGYTQTISWKKFDLELIVDFQKGGDVWNGTQNTLNYLGTSQQSAIERNITDFVFEGVNQQGVVNNVPVDFYNPGLPFNQNRFVRYGFGGIAEEAIEDGSYINIRSIDLSYTLQNDNGYNRIKNKKLIKQFKIKVYANNLFTWSRFSGRTPYNTLFGNRSADGLNFFNMPLFSEIGFSLNLKI